MSNKLFKYSKLYNILKESIDWENATEFPLVTNQFTDFDVDGYKVGMKIENFPNSERDFFPKDSILYNKFDTKTFYNFGFDIDGQTEQQYKTNYKILSKILGITVKSLFSWIRKNQPEIVTIFPSGIDDRENRKKLSIYGSILQGNESELKSMGYTFDGNMGRTNYLIIKKIK
jgi:hypothetical protein